jgi:DNA-binding MarR family transcriptional regulator
MLCRNSSFPNPFTVSFTEFKLKKGSVTDSQVSSLMTSKNKFLSSPSKFEQAQVQMRESSPKADLLETAKTLQSGEWEIIKILGSGQATFASQIYRLVHVSGGIFKKRAEKLIEKGVIGMSSAKIRKNRMNYYYLTDLGEEIYEMSFNPGKSRPGKEKMELKPIIETLTEDGWKCSLEGSRHGAPSNRDLEESTLVIKKGTQTLNISLKNSLDKPQPISPAESFMLCSSQTVKNIILQKAARLSADFRKGFTIFISTVKEFEETGELEEIEFIV